MDLIFSLAVTELNWNAAYGFWLVATHQSFANAARTLRQGSVQSLHKRVRGLESQDNLNLQLLRSRGVKGVELTEAGQQLYQFMNPFFRDFDRVAADLRRERTGRLELAVSSYVASHHLPAVIARFSPNYPEVSIHVRVCEPTEVIGNVESGRADIGISSPPSVVTSLAVVRACPISLEILIPHVIGKAQTFEQWEDVVRYPLILPEKASSVRQCFDKFMQERGLEKMVCIKAELATPELSCEAVRAGLGLALVAKIAPSTKNMEGIRRVNVPKGMPKSYLRIFKDRSRYTPKYADEFIRVAATIMNKPGGGHRTMG